MRKTLFESLTHHPFTEKPVLPADPEILRMAAELDAKSRRRLGRSLSLRLVDAGSCNGCELELNALSNPYYDFERFGLRFVASPRHADVLLVTGPVTKNMHEALLRTYNAMPAPKWVVAVGDCATCGGLYANSYACERGADAVLPVNLRISGCPPTPNRLLEGLLALFSVHDHSPGTCDRLSTQAPPACGRIQRRI